MQGAWTSLLWFAAIVALIPVTLWLLKRTPLGVLGGIGLGPPPGGSARTVGMLALSASQRVVTVEIGQGADRRWLVLGVTPGGISTLHTMAPQDDVQDAAAATPSTPAASFAAVLSKLNPSRGPKP